MRYQKTGEGNAWDFVGIAQEYDNGEKKSIILRPDRGDDISIPLNTFQSEY